MKKYILILTAVVLAVMSCSTDNIENGPSSLDIEIVPAWDITRGITSASQTVKLTVNLNVQTKGRTPGRSRSIRRAMSSS